MSRTRSSRYPGRPTTGLADTRAVVIAVLALALSFGSGAGVAITLSTIAGSGLGIAAGVSAGGATAVLLANALRELIKEDE